MWYACSHVIIVHLLSFKVWPLPMIYFANLVFGLGSTKTLRYNETNKGSPKLKTILTNNSNKCKPYYYIFDSSSVSSQPLIRFTCTLFYNNESFKIV